VNRALQQLIRGAVLRVLEDNNVTDPAERERQIARAQEEAMRQVYAGADISEVTRQLIERDIHGRKKYGVSLDRADFNVEDWLQHMAEELMDGAGYALAAKRVLQSMPILAIERCLADAMAAAAANGADSRSMPNYMVEVTSWLAGRIPKMEDTQTSTK
jgi:hypothetical protein